MPHRKAPKAGDKQLSATFLRDLDKKLDQLGKVSSSSGMSFGAAGIAFPNLQDDPAQLRRVYVPYAPGAFGGYCDTFGNVFSNDLAISYNTVIKKGVNDDGGKLRDSREARQVFPSKAWFLKTQNCYEDPNTEPETGGESTSKLLNYSTFPIIYGRGWATPLADNPEYWVLVAMDVDPFSRFYGLRYGVPDALEVGDGAWGTIVSGVPTQQFQPNSMNQTAYDFANAGGLGIETGLYINTPGDYEIDYGFTARILTGSYGGPTGTTVETSTVSGHSHAVVIPNEGSLTEFQAILVQMKLVYNWPGTTAFADVDMGGPLAFLGREAMGTVRHPRDLIQCQSTESKYHSLDNAHGSHYCRIIPIFGAASLGPDVMISSPEVDILHAWIKLRPCATQRQMHHGGLNPYAKLITGSTTSYQWWGGGPAPKPYDEFGIEIP